MKFRSAKRTSPAFTRRITGWLLMGACGMLSIYVFAASFETTFSYDLPLVSAVGRITTPPLTRLIETSRQTSQTDFGNYGTPGVLKLPAHDSRIVLAPAISRDGQLLARANTAHFELLSGQKGGNLGNILIYFNASWRTDSKADQIGPGENIFIDTDRDWRYFYRVDSVRELTKDSVYVARAAATAQMVLVAQTSQGHMLLAEASFVNVQNVRQ